MEIFEWLVYINLREEIYCSEYFGVINMVTKMEI